MTIKRTHMPPFAVVARGVATCIREPRDGERGLEGYNEGGSYRYEEVSNRDGRHMRVYPCGEDGPSPGYYECCGPDVFARFFEVKPP